MSKAEQGMRLESAASVLARDMITKHMRTFAHVIRSDRIASQSVVAAYIDGLAGVVALTIAGGHVSRESAEERVIEQFSTALFRDLGHLTRK